MILYKKIILFLIFVSFALYAGKDCGHDHNSNCNHSQSANTTCQDFANILNFAKYSSCKNVISKFEYLDKGFGKFIINKLESQAKDLFPWRFEITNGYKEGFFYYALLGYANEISGDIPFAYQCYRNATLYIDEEKSFNHPEPTAEIYLGIGRTCLAAGRYMDAKDWLDSAYEYANNNPNILAAIDRVAIQKGNELGDYENIILHYQHLERVESAKRNSPFSKGGKGDLSLTKPEIANYTQILFYSRKDREGFSKLLEGISKLGIDNNLGVKDPLVDKFLNNIMRADNEEVEYFYDLLGYEIEAARAKAGDEKYLAFLCNARTIFCKFYDFLNSENDLKKVKKRIDKVKKQLKQGYGVFGKNSKSVIRNPWSVKKKKINKSQNRKISKSGIAEELPEVELDNLLMQADWHIKNKSFSNALTNYLIATELATGTFANLKYDGTTIKNIAIMGAAKINLKKHAEAVNSYNSNFDFDNSYRDAELTLQLCQKATNDEQRTRYDIETAITLLPKAHPMILSYLFEEAERQTKIEDYENAIRFYVKLEENKGMLSVEVAKKLAAILFHLGKDKIAFSVLLKTLNNNRGSFYWKEIMQKSCFQSWSYASDEDLSVYYNSVLPEKIRLLLTFVAPMNPMRDAPTIMELLNWQKECYEKEKKVREAFQKGDFQNVIKLLSEKQKKAQPGQLIKKGIAYRELEKPDEAIDCFLEAIKKNEAMLKSLSSDNCFYHKEEIQLIKPLLEKVSTNKVFACYQQFSNLKNKLLAFGNTNDYSQIENIINNNSVFSEFTNKSKK